MNWWVDDVDELHNDRRLMSDWWTTGRQDEIVKFVAIAEKQWNSRRYVAEIRELCECRAMPHEKFFLHHSLNYDDRRSFKWSRAYGRLIRLILIFLQFRFW